MKRVLAQRRESRKCSSRATRRLRSEFPRDLLVRVAVSLDLAIRRAAWRAVSAVRARAARASAQD